MSEPLVVGHSRLDGEAVGWKRATENGILSSRLGVDLAASIRSMADALKELDHPLSGDNALAKYAGDILRKQLTYLVGLDYLTRLIPEIRMDEALAEAHEALRDEEER